jgi:predicted small secreted protein
MRKIVKLIIAAVLVAGTLLYSCNKDKDIKTDDDAIKRYLEIKSKMASFQNNNGDANLEALGASIINEKKKSLKLDGDSSGIDTGYWYNWTCAEVTEFIDEEGNNVTIYDYGVDGCDEWGSLVSGKITYIWSESNGVYYSEVIYENYSGYGMTMNGFSEYTYTFDDMNYGNEGDSTVYSINWSGSSTCMEDIVMSFEGEGTWHYTADYSSEWDENSYTVHEGEYSCQNTSSGYGYTYTILEDLFYNYTCGWEIWVAVSGIEQIDYVDAEVSSTFLTNYGDGTCDNLASVTENGITYVVDFGELWYWEPCEDENCDSVVVCAGK